MQNLSVAMNKFNERVKLMNQTGTRQLVLTVDEARNLHADMFTLLYNLVELQTRTEVSLEPTSISLDGGGF
jgi:type II secretory pathway predicted ATPase ExeA